ncbi:MAG: hypothetical protein B7Z24_02045, partial [Pseudomonadales bacterium 32-42-5]
TNGNTNETPPRLVNRAIFANASVSGLTVCMQLFLTSQFYNVALISVWPRLKWIATNQHRSAKVLKK